MPACRYLLMFRVDFTLRFTYRRICYARVAFAPAPMIDVIRLICRPCRLLLA